jgi:hypothetical protein
MLSPKYKLFHSPTHPKGKGDGEEEDSKIISLNYWQWDDTLMKRRVYDSEDSIGHCIRWFYGTGCKLSFSKYWNLLSLHL